MSSRIVPPLKLYNYSPVSPANSSPGTAVSNNSFFNSTNSLYSVAISIANNKALTSFNKNALIQTYNTCTKLYLTNDNNILSAEIGNLISKDFNIKENINSIFNYRNGNLITILMYDKDNYYGTIIVSNDKTYKISLNSNGSSSNGTYGRNVIYADGYYAYLTNNVTTYNIITVEVLDSIRIVTIPPDPTSKYELINVVAKYNMVNLCYFNNIESNYISNNQLVINDYFLNANLTQDINLTLPVGNFLANYINTPNTINTSNIDGIQLQVFSIPKTSQILKQGNILGLLVSYNKAITTTGTNIKSELASYGVILFASGDFEYLNNESVLLYPYIQNVDNISGTKTLQIPIVPGNYVIPITKVLPNSIIDGITTFNTFYYEKLNNANVYNPSINTQSYTLGTTNMYDSYDFVTNIPGNIIGCIVIYKITSKSLEGIQTTSTITSYNFINGSSLFTATVDNYSLTNIGDLIAGVVRNENIISNSLNYDQAFNGCYNLTVNSGSKINTVFVNSIIN